MREYIIDPITRKIRILKDESTIGVYNDKNVEEVQFSLTDENLAAELFGYNVYINYLAPNSESVQQDQTGEKSYDAENNKLTFSWLIGRSATQGVGKVIFIVCFQKVVDGEVEKEWNTTVASVSVLEGLEPELTEEEQELLASYYDTLVERLHEAGEAVIESIPQDYTALCEEVEDVKEDLAEFKYGGGGLTDEARYALLACFEQVAWIGDDGQDYYDVLESALFPVAKLMSISAVYTQDSVIYPNYSLDDLIDGLVVTAHYDDGSTQTIPSSRYTLSGTLTAGTSVITVTYARKTTTFNVTVTAILHPFENGTFTYTTHPHTLVVSGGNKVVDTYPVGDNYAVFANVSKISDNTTASNVSDNFNNYDEPYFTLHNGETLTAKLTVDSVVADSRTEFACTFRDMTGTTVLNVTGQTKLDSVIVGQEFTASYTASSDVDIGCFSLYMGSKVGNTQTSFGFVVEAYIDNTRII